MFGKSFNSIVAGAALGLSAGPVMADQVFNDDVIVDGSLCVGFDCVNGENFGFDTIRLKENNLRIDFTDTSTSASFPSGDWKIVINDTANGGDSHFTIQDVTNSRNPFRVDQGAPGNSLRIDSTGDVGFGINNPVVDVHIRSGNTPTLRLDQDGSSGFATQTWDVAGNETNFFVRDVTNGSDLPFKIFPNPGTNALTIEGGTGDIGMGIRSPEGALHINTGSDNTDLLLEQTGTTAATWIIRNNEATGRLTYRNDTTGLTPFKMGNDAVENLLRVGISANDEVDVNGDLVVSGTVTTGGPQCGAGCDRVFDADYDLLSIEDHAALMFAKGHLPAVGPTGPDIPMNVTDKMGDMLNELEHAHIYIAQQQEVISELSARLVALEEKLLD